MDAKEPGAQSLTCVLLELQSSVIDFYFVRRDPELISVQWSLTHDQTLERQDESEIKSSYFDMKLKSCRPIRLHATLLEVGRNITVRLLYYPDPNFK